jgi:hypothetical protein
MSELRTNRIVPRDGISASGTCGGVIQMKVAQLDTALDLTAAGDIMSTTYTPIRSDSKILIDIRLRAREDTGNNATWYVGLKKTIGGVDSYPGGQYMMHCKSNTSTSEWGGYYQMVVDSAGGSSEITYTLIAGPWGSANGTSFNVNKSAADGELGGAQLIIYEVSG